MYLKVLKEDLFGTISSRDPTPLSFNAEVSAFPGGSTFPLNNEWTKSDKKEDKRPNKCQCKPASDTRRTGTQKEEVECM